MTSSARVRSPTAALLFPIRVLIRARCQEDLGCGPIIAAFEQQIELRGEKRETGSPLALQGCTLRSRVNLRWKLGILRDRLDIVQVPVRFLRPLAIVFDREVTPPRGASLFFETETLDDEGAVEKRLGNSSSSRRAVSAAAKAAASFAGSSPLTLAA